ncbi:MAG: ArsR/SmtB family transcription factor [Terriglobales bacterium]
MQELTDYFKGLADSNRLRILNLLLHGELCGCDIQYLMGTSQSNVSRHLTYLKNCGLVTDRRVGFRVFYSLAEDKHDVLKPLFKFLRGAFSNEEILAQDTRKLKKAIESGSCSVNQWRPYSALGTSKSLPAHV